MRWIFWVLLLINIGYLGFQLFSAQPQQARPIAISQAESSPTLYLLQERPDLARAAATKKEEGQSSPPMAATTDQPICFLVGPFVTASQANPIQERIAAKGGRVALREQEFSGVEYWVYLPPYRYDSDAETKAAELRHKGFEAVVMHEGAFARAVSLGKFRHKDFADEQVRKAAELGYQAEQRTMNRSGKETWLYVAPAGKESVSPVLDKLIATGQDFHKEVAPCEQ